MNRNTVLILVAVLVVVGIFICARSRNFGAPPEAPVNPPPAAEGRPPS